MNLQKIQEALDDAVEAKTQALKDDNSPEYNFWDGYEAALIHVLFILNHSTQKDLL